MLRSSPGPNEWACLNASGKPHYSAEGIFEWVSVVIRRGQKVMPYLWQCLSCLPGCKEASSFSKYSHALVVATSGCLAQNLPRSTAFRLQAVEISQVHQAPYHTVGLRDRHISSTMGSKFRVQASPPPVFLTKVSDVSQEVHLLDPLYFGLSSAIYMRVRPACLSVEIPIFWGNCCSRFG